MPLGEELQKARKARRLTASEVAAATRMKVQIVQALEHEDFEKIAAPIYAKGFIKLYAEYVGLNPKPLIDEYISRYVSPPPEPVFDNEMDYDEPEHDTGGRKFLFPRRKPPEPEPEQEPGEAEEDVQPVESAIVGGPVPRDVPERKDEEPYDLFSGVAVRGGDDFHPEEDREPMLGEFGTQLGPDKALAGAVGAGRAATERAGRFFGQIRMGLAALEFGSPLRIASAVVILMIVFVFVVSTLSRCAGPSGPGEKPPALAVEEDLNIAVDPPDTYLD